MDQESKGSIRGLGYGIYDSSGTVETMRHLPIFLEVGCGIKVRNAEHTIDLLPLAWTVLSVLTAVSLVFRVWSNCGGGRDHLQRCPYLSHLQKTCIMIWIPSSSLHSLGETLGNACAQEARWPQCRRRSIQSAVTCPLPHPQPLFIVVFPGIAAMAAPCVEQSETRRAEPRGRDVVRHCRPLFYAAKMHSHPLIGCPGPYRTEPWLLSDLDAPAEGNGEASMHLLQVSLPNLSIHRLQS
ncbi:hypothetical protein P154DRAFT_50796 [Amniculicola lignicola CBS 123094]|uniref:Uncharacterized protein n=1 Tax=Amniculicola lignicola CBS 123094 TaxID=1392246 RepID=A0A6A5WQR0_9PLEO|nr:hypothetical protein P154DRAFT_50796 [Amniculicola lignicola CBS 123094]